jgi:hypothetical protein
MATPDDPPDTDDPADLLLATALASGKTLEGAGELVGVSKSTAYRRMRDPEFAALVASIRREQLVRTVGVLTEAMPRAAAVLLEIAESPETKDTARVAAAKALLGEGFRGHEVVDIAPMLEKLTDGLAAVAAVRAGERDAGGTDAAGGEGWAAE